MTMVEESAEAILAQVARTRRYDPTLGLHRNRVVGRWLSFDTALTENDDSAYSACTVGELWPDYRLAVRDVWRDRIGFPLLPPQIEALATKWNYDEKLQGVIIEDKSSGTPAIQTIRATAQPWLINLLVPFQPGGDKPSRAKRAAVWCANGSILLPLPGPTVPWLFDFERELFGVPTFPTWDQVDTFSQLVIYLEHYLSAGLDARLAAAGMIPAGAE
jgi:phage terminase large subunit-like protein